MKIKTIISTVISGALIQIWILCTAHFFGLPAPPIPIMLRDTGVIITSFLALEAIRHHGAVRGRVYFPIFLFFAVYRSHSQTCDLIRQIPLFLKGTATCQILILWHIGLLSFFETVGYTTIALLVYLIVDIAIEWQKKKVLVSR